MDEYVTPDPIARGPTLQNVLREEWKPVLAILLLSIILRVAIFFYFLYAVGGEFYITAEDGPIRWFRYLILRPRGIIPLQAYDDLWYHYIAYVRAFTSGWNPYSSPGFPNPQISGNYNYGPLYLIFISFFALFGLSPFLSIYLSTLIFESGTTVLLYALARKFSSRLQSVITTLAIVASPVMLFYVDYKLFNIAQILFFSVLFLVLFFEDRFDLATICLALGFMTKFVPVFFMVPHGMYLHRRYGAREVMRHIFLFAGYSLAIILPFVIEEPRGVLSQFINAGTRSGIDGISLDVLVQNIQGNLPFILLLVITPVLFYRNSDYFVQSDAAMLQLFTFFITATHGSFYGLWSRGFKYYTPYFFPLLVMFVLLSGNTRKSMIGGLCLTYILNLLVLLLPPAEVAYNQRRVVTILIPAFLLVYLVVEIRRTRRESTIE